MGKTQIEWVKNPDGSQGYTLNDKTGCKNHTPEGLCLGGLFPCYAWKLAHTRLKPLYLANKNIPPAVPATNLTSPIYSSLALIDPFYPRFWENRLQEVPALKKYTGRFSSEVKNALIEKQRKGIFLDDMSDWMGDCWLREWTLAELQMMRENPQHRFYTLTKQPQRLPEFSPFPDNCWVGVTITDGDDDKTPLAYLKKVEAKVKYISFEPLLHWWDCASSEMIAKSLEIAGIDWLIIGACTGTVKEMAGLIDKYPDLAGMRYGNKWTAQPPIEWVKEIVEAADKAGVKVFLKDNLSPLLEWPDSGSWAFKDYSNAIRQEMPE